MMRSQDNVTIPHLSSNNDEGKKTSPVSAYAWPSASVDNTLYSICLPFTGRLYQSSAHRLAPKTPRLVNKADAQQKQT